MNQNICKLLVVKSRKFLSPYLAKMDVWRQMFVPQLIKGMIQSGGLVVTEMARKLRLPGEPMNAVWQRLRRHLKSPCWSKFEEDVRQQFARDQVNGITEWTPIVVDLSDLSKPYARKMEYLATVRDADESSKRGGPVLNSGYWIFESFVPLGPAGDPLPVVCFPFSVEDPNVGSQNRALDQGFECLRKALGSKGILVMDRGFDSEAVFRFLEEKRMRFLCRLVGNRTLLDVDRRSLGVAESLAERMPPTHEADFPIWKKHKKSQQRLLFSWRQVRLPGTGQPCTFIAVRWPGKNHRPLMLLSNAAVVGMHQVIKLIRFYFLRWRCEDAIRILKKELGLETVRVFDFDSIRRLIEFGFWILAMISLITIELTESQKRTISFRMGTWHAEILLFHYRVFAQLRSSLARHGPRFLSPGHTNGGKT